VPSVGATNWAERAAHGVPPLARPSPHRLHRRKPHPRCAQERASGYQAALKLKVSSRTPTWSAPAPSPRVRLRADHGVADLPRPPTAIFAGNDTMAFGCYSALRARGVRVPDAISSSASTTCSWRRLSSRAHNSPSAPCQTWAASPSRCCCARSRAFRWTRCASSWRPRWSSRVVLRARPPWQPAGATVIHDIVVTATAMALRSSRTGACASVEVAPPRRCVVSSAASRDAAA